jgi:hypothetical protein
MFIPRGKPIHESLATSYLLLEKLAAELCSQDFSGVIQILLRDSEAFIVIGQGEIIAVIEKRVDEWGQTTIESLAERARTERGTVSVYAYDPPTTDAVAGRLRAQSLYLGLSTDFTDPRKVLSKLASEREREWFIEINSNRGSVALMHLRDGRCRVMGPEADAIDTPSIEENGTIGRLLDECKQVGGTFDVLFNHPAQVGAIENSRPPSGSLASENLTHNAGKPEADVAVAPVEVAQDEGSPGEAEALTEVKRLIGEIAGTVEEAARAVGPHDSFAMSLRAAGLKIADRYPFLDPFGGQFEYLGGEIVLVAQITVEDLISGTSEALALTVSDLARATAYADRFRAYISEDLRRLLVNKRSDFERFSLDRVIERLIEVVGAVEPVRESALTKPAIKQ